MKTEEDEAFDELARRQGAWGGGFQAKRQAAMDKINSHFDAAYKKMHEDRAMYGTSWSRDGERIDPASVYLEQPAHDPDALTIAYQSGYYDGKKAALATREWNFCERCGKRTKDMFTIHTCTPPQGAA
jgi:hypothetical protein